MKEEKALVPKLRFQEYRDAKEWHSTVLGEVPEVVRGGSPRPIDGFLTPAVDGLNWLKIGDVDKEAYAQFAAVHADDFSDVDSSAGCRRKRSDGSCSVLRKSQ